MVDASTLHAATGGEHVVTNPTTAKWIDAQKAAGTWKPNADGSNKPDPSMSKKIVAPGTNYNSVKAPGSSMKAPGSEANVKAPGSSLKAPGSV